MAGSTDELEEQVQGAIIEATDPDNYDGRKIARAAISAVLRGVRLPSETQRRAGNLAARGQRYTAMIDSLIAKYTPSPDQGE